MIKLMANRVAVEVSANVEGFKEGMNQASDSAKKYETETRKVADAQVNLMKELKAAKKEVQNLAAGYAKLDDEAKKSAFGQEMAKQLQIAKEKAAEYIDLQGDLNRELQNMASDTATFDTLADGLSAMGSTMSAVTGTIGIFTDDTETMTKAVTYFTTAESIASAAIKVKNLLQKESSLMLGISKVQQLAATAAVELDTVAKGKNAVATGAATVAQKALNAAANANPYILLATAVLGVVTALYAFTSSSEDAAEAQKRLQNEIAVSTDRAIENANAYYTAAGAVTTYLQAVGASQEKLDAEQIRRYTEQINKLEAAYNKAKREGADEATIKRAFDAWQGAKTRLSNYKLEIEATQHATETLLATWHTLNTEKQINAAINAFRKLRSEYVQGSKEYNEMTRRIEILQKKLNPTKTTRPKKNAGDTKKDIEAAVGSIADLEKQISDLQDLAKKGALPKELNDPAKYSAELERLQKKLKDLKIKWSFEEPETKLKQLQDDVDKAKKAFILAVDINDRQAQEAAYKAYQAAQKKLNEYELSIKLTPELSESELRKQAEEIQKTVKDALHPNVELSSTFDFSGLDNFEGLKQFQKPANEVIKAMERIENARKELTKTMNSEDATDTQIAAAQQGLEELSSEYNKLQESASIYQTLSDEANKAIEKNRKLAETYADISDACASVGDAFSSLAQMADNDPALNIMGIVAQAVAQMFAGYATATAQAASMGPWAWVAFAATGLAQTLAIVAQIKEAAQFAYGGILPDSPSGTVGGSSYGGDRIWARLNSGEMVLNKRQQRNLFDLLDMDVMPQRGGTNVQVTGVIRGSDLILVQKNTNKVRSKSGTQIYF